jgi:hypothetical protein
MATRSMSFAKQNNRMEPDASISQINRYVVLDKSVLSEKKITPVRTASRPGILRPE